MLRFIRPFNDIHLDFDIGKKTSNLWFPKAMPDDLQTALIISGDLWHSMKTLSFNKKSWMAEVSKNFHSVIYVLGNHDLWGGNITFDYKKNVEEIKKQKLNNVYLLQNSSVEIEGFLFAGSTLWTDFKKNDPLVGFAFREQKDAKLIKIGYSYKKINQFNILDEHEKAKRFLFSLKKNHYKKLIAISHHAPSFLSIAEDYKRDLGSFFYFSNLDEEIYNSDYDFWFHGHTHEPKDYMINKTRIVNNPRGYNGFENTGYDEDKIISLE